MCREVCVRVSFSSPSKPLKWSALKGICPDCACFCVLQVTSFIWDFFLMDTETAVVWSRKYSPPPRLIKRTRGELGKFGVEHNRVDGRELEARPQSVFRQQSLILCNFLDNSDTIWKHSQAGLKHPHRILCLVIDWAATVRNNISIAKGKR